MDEIIRIWLPFMGAFDLTDDNYRLLARRISGASRGHSCLLNPKVHVSPCDYFLAPHISYIASFKRESYGIKPMYILRHPRFSLST